MKEIQTLIELESCIHSLKDGFSANFSEMMILFDKIPDHPQKEDFDDVIGSVNSLLAETYHFRKKIIDFKHFFSTMYDIEFYRKEFLSHTRQGIDTLKEERLKLQQKKYAKLQ